MRTYYIFKIKKEIAIILKETPYNLFKTILDLYYLDSDDIGVSFYLYNKLFDKFDKEYINNKINNVFENYKYYSNDGDVHYIYNKYRPENTTLRTYKSHLLIKSDSKFR